MKSNVRKYTVIALTLIIVLTVCIIFSNSLKGPAESLEQSHSVGEVIRPIVDPDEKLTDEEYSFLVRKSGHFIEYAILGFECAILAFILCEKLTLPGVIYSAFGCLFTADIDEFIQSFTERGSKVSDVLLDFCGALTGIALGFALSYAVRYIYRKNSQKQTVNNDLS